MKGNVIDTQGHTLTPSTLMHCFSILILISILISEGLAPYGHWLVAKHDFISKCKQRLHCLGRSSALLLPELVFYLPLPRPALPILSGDRDFRIILLVILLAFPCTLLHSNASPGCIRTKRKNWRQMPRAFPGGGWLAEVKEEKCRSFPLSS